MGMGIVWVIADSHWKEIDRVGPCDAIKALQFSKIFSNAEFLVGFVGERPIDLIMVRSV